MTVTPSERRLHPIVPVLMLLKQLPEMLVPMAGLVAVAWDEGFATLLLLVTGALAILLVFQILAWWRFTYTLLPDEMFIQSGIFARNRRSIPWDRIQDVEIERGPLARLLGLAKVKLETGAAGTDEGLLDSIALDDALALRAEVRSRRGIAPGTAHETASAAPPLFMMTTARILQAGLFNFSVIWLAILIGAYQYFKEVLPWTIDDVEAWIGDHQREIWGFVSPLTILLALAVFLALGSIAGVIEMFVRNYGFTLSHEGRTLRRVRGLFTRSEIAIPLHRVQAARTAAHWLQRRLGLCRVDVQTMGGSSAGGLQDLAPLANGNETQEILTIAGNFVPVRPAHFEPVAPAHTWYDAQLGALPLALVLMAAGLIWPQAWWGLPLIATLAAVQVTGARPHGWRLEGDTLHIRHGWFTQDHWMLPLANIQSVSLSIGPVQRRRGLATIGIDSAGAPIGGLRIRNLTVTGARNLAERLRTRGPRGPAASAVANGGPTFPPAHDIAH